MNDASLAGLEPFVAGRMERWRWPSERERAALSLVP